MYFSAGAEGRISYGHLGRTNLLHVWKSHIRMHASRDRGRMRCSHWLIDLSATESGRYRTVMSPKFFRVDRHDAHVVPTQKTSATKRFDNGRVYCRRQIGRSECEERRSCAAVGSQLRRSCNYCITVVEVVEEFTELTHLRLALTAAPVAAAATVATDWTGAGATLLIVGWLANLTVIGSVAPGGTVPDRSLIAASASDFRLKRMKPTPFVRPETQR